MRNLKHENYKELFEIPGIYGIKINDKYYVGGSTNIGYRLKHHLWTLSNNRHHNRTMQNLFNKYGVEEMFFELIENCSADCLIDREKYFIDTLKPYMNHILNPVKVVRDDVYRERLSNGLKKAYANGLRPHNDKVVYMYDMEGNYLKMFDTCTSAANTFNKTDPAAICLCARGDNYTAYGYRWSYNKVKKLPSFRKKYAYKPVIQLTLNKVFMKEWGSAKEAETQLSITNISRAATKNKTAGGYRWKYKS